MDIHNFDKQYQSAIRYLRNKDISDRNKLLISDFNSALILENLSKPRLIRYMHVMSKIAEGLDKDLDKADISDIKCFISKIQQKSDYSPYTKQMYKIMIRRFYKWLCGTKDFPEIVSWINIKISKTERPTPTEEDLLTETDIQKLIKSADHPRDKAFISILWESGARIGEIGGLSLKNVTIDKYGLVLMLKGKTGSRKIRLISSTPYLSTWINNHPYKNNPNSPLWINIGSRNNKQMVRYDSIRFLLRMLFRKAEVNKRYNPHLFRHSRATFMANHLTEFQMNQYFGWIQGSDMPSTYVHMSGREVDDAILTMNGIKTEEKKKESQILPRICVRCDCINAFDSKHCNKCGGILDLKYAMELEQKHEEEIKMRSSTDELMNMLLKDKDVQKLLMEKLISLKTSAI